MKYSKLKSTLRDQRFARLTRQFTKNDKVINRGYLTGVSKQLIVMRETENFSLLATIAFPTAHVSNIRYNENDAYYDHIMEQECEKAKLKKTPYEISSWEALLADLMHRDKYVIIECERKSFSFYIGKIESVKKNSVFITYFDATGRLDDHTAKIKYKDITKITFDDRYISVFRRYLRNC